MQVHMDIDYCLVKGKVILTINLKVRASFVTPCFWLTCIHSTKVIIVHATSLSSYTLDIYLT